jgi:hypothetical protein
MCSGCIRPIDIVNQCGLRRFAAVKANAVGVGLRGSCEPNVARTSMGLPRYARYRVSHVPPPLQTDYVQTYAREKAAKLENCRMDTSMHSNFCLNRPTYAVRPRSPVEARYSAVQETLYYMSPVGPRILERKGGSNWDYFEDRARSVEMTTRGSSVHGTRTRGIGDSQSGMERMYRTELFGEDYVLLPESPSGLRRCSNSQHSGRFDKEPVWISAGCNR